MTIGSIETRIPFDALGRWIAALVEVLGLRVMTELVEFASDSEPGAMITIRHTRDGFTAQVTGSIVGGHPQPLTPQAIRALVRGFEQPEG